MTRKRFTKLLLAGGWSPRAAEAWAQAAQSAGLAYGEVFENLARAGCVCAQRFPYIMCAPVRYAKLVIRNAVNTVCRGRVGQ